jgi:hypothetical protein
MRSVTPCGRGRGARRCTSAASHPSWPRPARAALVMPMAAWRAVPGLRPRPRPWWSVSEADFCAPPAGAAAVPGCAAAGAGLLEVDTVLAFTARFGHDLIAMPWGTIAGDHCRASADTVRRAQARIRRSSQAEHQLTRPIAIRGKDKVDGSWVLLARRCSRAHPSYTHPRPLEHLGRRGDMW